MLLRGRLRGLVVLSNCPKAELAGGICGDLLPFTAVSSVEKVHLCFGVDLAGFVGPACAIVQPLRPPVNPRAPRVLPRRLFPIFSGRMLGVRWILPN